MNKLNHTNTIKNDRFPSSLFLVYFLVLLLMSGIHTGIIVGMNALGWNKIIQVILPLGYWTVVAVGLTLFTKNVIRKSYEKPMHDLADATKKVAEGDFSVYVPTLHTADRLDYLDVMIIDFNKMVEELGSIETLKTDFSPMFPMRSRRRLQLSRTMRSCSVWKRRRRNKKNMPK